MANDPNLFDLWLKRRFPDPLRPEIVVALKEAYALGYDTCDRGFEPDVPRENPVWRRIA
jgi:hypothetical protein